MRVIAGEFRGRRLATPKGRATRPTTDRVREALFSSLVSRLGPDLGGAVVLDAFAGTGALGIEALSRGAAHATFVERDRAALEGLRANVETLGIRSRATIVAGDTARVARVAGVPYSLILLDPPYKLAQELVPGLLGALVSVRRVASGALVVVESAEDASPAWPDGFSVVSSKTYGGTRVEIAEYREEADLT